MSYRAKLTPKPNGKYFVLGNEDESNVLYPLHEYDGLVFPYTPSINFGHTAEYKDYDIVQSNYNINTFIRSRPSNITLEAPFTAQTNQEAKYMLAAMHFFRANTKMYFGAQDSASNETKLRSGTPPPVLNFSFMGKFMFENVPVVIETFSMVIDSSTHYVEVPEFNTQVPVYAVMNLVLNINYNPDNIRKQFDMDQFREGKFLNNRGTGGFI